jgi:uncharacterized SAM-binding protein YcdF (DUF218 family)
MSHVIEVLVRPTFLAYFVMALALGWLWRTRRDDRPRLLWVIVPFLLVIVISIPAIAYLALGTLEWTYGPSASVPERPEAIVVLSGSMFAPDGAPDQAEVGPDTFSRCMHALRLYRQVGSCPLLLSGGISEGAPHGPSLAETMRRFLVQLGVNSADLILEDRSRTTQENAVECAQILRARGVQRILLITDAKHLGRASRCFQRQGLEVVPSACNHYTVRFRNRLENYLPSPEGAGRFVEAFHEWLGIAYYKLRGWI